MLWVPRPCVFCKGGYRTAGTDRFAPPLARDFNFATGLKIKISYGRQHRTRSRKKREDGPPARNHAQVEVLADDKCSNKPNASGRS